MSVPDFLPLRGIDHVEFYVGNAKQAAYYYQHAFGCRPVAYAGPETRVRDRASYVLEQGSVRLVLTAPLGPAGPIADHVHRHGDGVKAVAFLADDVERAFAETTARGARPVAPPEAAEDEHGYLRRATIAAYGDTVHTFVDRSDYTGLFAPGYRRLEATAEPVGIVGVDHVVANVELGQMNTWTHFYASVMGFNQLISFDDKDISTEYSALMSKVMQDSEGRIKLPINEPAAGKKRSQIEEFLDFYGGPGVQHIALLTDDAITTVDALQRRGVEFLRVPGSYYDRLPDRVGSIDESLAEIRRLGLLVDRDDEGYLLQIFTKPVEDRPTLFYEIIQRKGSRSFGKGNFKALFEAIEREQALRGTL